MLSAFSRDRNARLRRLLLRKEREQAKEKRETKNELTERQREILNFIRLFSEKNGFPPTRYEISMAFGFRSTNAAQGHLSLLEKKGVISIVQGTARGIRLVNSDTASLPEPNQTSIV